MELWSYVFATVILGALGLVLLYFVIKNAIKNALIEDRAFQVKVERMRAEKAAARAAQPRHVDADGV